MKSKVSKDSYNRVFLKHKSFLLRRLFSKKGFCFNLDRSVQKFVFFSVIRNRCVLSFKGRSVFSMFRVSSFSLRRVALEGKVCGLRKQSWLFLALVVEFGKHGNFKVYFFYSLLVRVQPRVFFCYKFYDPVSK